MYKLNLLYTRSYLIPIYYVLAPLLTPKFEANVVVPDDKHLKPASVILIAKGSILIT